jgi:hypothetical protein
MATSKKIYKRNKSLLGGGLLKTFKKLKLPFSRKKQ